MREGIVKRVTLLAVIFSALAFAFVVFYAFPADRQGDLSIYVMNTIDNLGMSALPLRFFTP